MPLHDFSAGYPRNGQWVLVDGKRLGIFCRESATKVYRVPAAAAPARAPAKTAAAVAALEKSLEDAIVERDAKREAAVRDELKRLGATVEDEKRTIVRAVKKLVLAKDVPHGRSKGRVEYVGEEGEYTTAEMVELDRLTPLLDRRLVPAKRLEKMDPAWVPTA